MKARIKLTDSKVYVVYDTNTGKSIKYFATDDGAYKFLTNLNKQYATTTINTR